MDRIKGIVADREIDRLIQEKKWFKIQIPSKNYERISIVVSRHAIEGEDYLQIDTPLDLQKILDGAKRIEFLFEFRGSDNIRYQFNSSRWHFLNDQLWVLQPEGIDRIQNRNNFRIQAPIEANLTLQHNELQLKFRLENISVSGAFASIRSKSLQHANIFDPVIGQQFAGLELFFPLDVMDTPIYILQAQIIRIEKGYQKIRDGYAFYFIEIENSQKNLLTRVVYQLQRRFLKERIKE